MLVPFPSSPYLFLAVLCYYYIFTTSPFPLSFFSKIVCIHFMSSHLSFHLFGYVLSYFDVPLIMYLFILMCYYFFVMCHVLPFSIAGIPLISSSTWNLFFFLFRHGCVVTKMFIPKEPCEKNLLNRSISVVSNIMIFSILKLSA